MAEGRAGEIEPVYLTLTDVLELYALIISASAAEAADQLRNRGPAWRARLLVRKRTPTTRTPTLRSRRLCSPMGSPRASAFIDGNKRTALIAMLVFLEINGWRVEASDPELADWILGFSAGSSPEEIAGLIGSAMRAIE